jgi:hypothetical protein
LGGVGLGLGLDLELGCASTIVNNTSYIEPDRRCTSTSISTDKDDEGLIVHRKIKPLPRRNKSKQLKVHQDAATTSSTQPRTGTKDVNGNGNGNGNGNVNTTSAANQNSIPTLILTCATPVPYNDDEHPGDPSTMPDPNHLTPVHKRRVRIKVSDLVQNLSKVTTKPEPVEPLTTRKPLKTMPPSPTHAVPDAHAHVHANTHDHARTPSPTPANHPDQSSSISGLKNMLKSAPKLLRSLYTSNK